MEKSPRDSRKVLDTTEARQGNRKMANMRVLLGSLLLALIFGIILVTAFWRVTPPSMDADSNSQKPTAIQPAGPSPSP